jgi:hypothetical protein
MFAEQRAPAVQVFLFEGRRGEMIKAPTETQDLRRKIYIKAKADRAHEKASDGNDGVRS